MAKVLLPLWSFLDPSLNGSSAPSANESEYIAVLPLVRFQSCWSHLLNYKGTHKIILLDLTDQDLMQITLKMGEFINLLSFLRQVIQISNTLEFLMQIKTKFNMHLF